jgi:hypothetical protein
MNYQRIIQVSFGYIGANTQFCPIFVKPGFIEDIHYQKIAQRKP